MSIEKVVNEDLQVINFFLMDMKMNILDEKALNFNFRRIYKIKVNNSIIAFICYLMLVDEIELEAIYVKPEFRNNGYGSKLVEFMTKEALQLNYKNIFLEVRVSNKSAIQLYEKYGFEIANCREKYYGQEDGIVMKKEVR